jgi:hypothetical protein
MPSKARHSSGQNRRVKSRKSTDTTFEHAPQNFASLIRGLYGRVARQLGVDPSYVSRVARGERQSQLVEDALKSNLDQVVQEINKQRDRAASKVASKRKGRVPHRNKKGQT